MNILSIIQSSIGQSTSQDQSATGKEWLIANARAYWDFRGISGNEDDSLNSRTDLTGNGWDLSNSGTSLTPKLGFIQSGFSLTSSLKARTPSGVKDALHSSAISQNLTLGTRLFNGDFDFIFTAILEDGQSSALNMIMGSDDGGTRNIECYFNTSGSLVFKYAAGSGLSTWTGTGAEVRNEMTGLIVVRVQLDFANDTVKMWVNGIPITVTLTSGNAISAWTSPQSWYTNQGIGVGGRWNGTAFLADVIATKYILQMAICPIISDVNYLAVNDNMIKL